MAELSPWPPTSFVGFIRGFDTSVGTSEILTDAGPAFIKALGNRGGPHHLASEWVGSNLARWFGLPTFDFAILRLHEGDHVPFVRGGCAAPGPAFVTRSEAGTTWDVNLDQLNALANPQHIGRLIVFDTWVLNWDRHPPDSSRRPNYGNVYLSEVGAPPGRFLIKAMDHTHCFGCRGGELTRRIDGLDHIRDERIFGLFPLFRPLVDLNEVEASCRQLATLPRGEVERIVAAIPSEWEVSAEVRGKLVEQITRRAVFVAERFSDLLRVQLTDA